MHDFKSRIDGAKPNKSRKSWNSDFSDYERKEKINNLAETVFRLNIALCEFDEAIRYFKENNVERDSEVSLYVLLSLLLEYELKEYWLREYDKAVKERDKAKENAGEDV